MKKKYLLLIAAAIIILLFVLYKSLFVHLKVETRVVSRGNLITVVYAIGSVTADSIATLRSEAGGIVKFVSGWEGSYIEKGSLLLKTDQSDKLLQLQQVQSDLDEANIEVLDKEVNYNRAEKLFKSKSISQKEYDNFKRDFELALLKVNQTKISVNIAKENLLKTEIYAPFSGIIVDVEANLGDNLTPNSKCFELIAPTSMLVAGEVDEQDLSKIQIGQKSVIAFDAYPDKKFNADVLRIVPKTNETTKTSKIYLRLAERPKNLNVGMTATININAGEKKNVLLIPRTALFRKGDNDFVFKVQNDELKQVKIVAETATEGSLTEVLKGDIKEGDIVVINPKDNFKDGMIVDIEKQ